MKWETFYNLYSEYILKASKAYDIDESLLAGLIMQESLGSPTATSHCGAYGLTQIMPATAKDRGYDLSTPEKQIYAGADYLHWIDKYFAFGDIEKILVGYNAGVGRIKNDAWKQFKETVDYIPRVLRYADQYREYKKKCKSNGGQNGRRKQGLENSDNSN